MIGFRYANKNKYQKFSKISEPKFRQIIRYFALDLTASDTARLTGISVRSINNLYLKLRVRLAQLAEHNAPLSGIVEMDESYFGAQRIRGKRGRGAGGKTIVFGILKRGETVYTEIVPNAAKATLLKVIRGHLDVQSTLSMPMVGVPMMAWLMSVTKNTFGCTMATTSLPVAISISMG